MSAVDPERTPTELRRALEDLDAKMAETRAILARLAAGRREIAAKLKAVVYSRILALPHEILANIFIECSTGLFIGSDDQPVGETLFPVAIQPLLGVCRTWRNVALRLAKLWSTIHIRANDQEVARVESFLKLCLSRSGGHALSVDIALSSAPERWFAVFAPLANRLKTLELEIGDLAVIPMDVIPADLPILSTLRLYGHNMNQHPISESLWSDSERTISFPAPALTELHVWQVSSKWITVPWDHLTTLGTANLDWSETIELLKLVPQLTDLRLSVSLYGEDDGQDESVVAVSCAPLERLQSLTLQHWEMSDARILRALFLPALKSLEVEFELGFEGPIPQLVSLLDRSGAVLSTLTTKGVNADELHTLIADSALHMAELTALHIEDLEYPLQPHLRMLIKDNGTWRLPRLKTLRITFPRVWLPEVAFLQTLAAAATSSLPQLTKVEVDVPTPIGSPSDEEREARYQAARVGLQEFVGRGCEYAVRMPRRMQILSNKRPVYSLSPPLDYLDV